MWPHIYYPYRSEQETGLIGDIRQAINGEYSAIACYERLAGLASREEERKQILEIREDEIRHFHTFMQIYKSLTGQQLVPQITEECPTEYARGLEEALKDEQETVDFYLSISEKTTDPYIKESFRRAAADEQNHAVWFLYYWVRNK